MLGDQAGHLMLRNAHVWCTRNLPTLDPARKHSSRDLCGSDTWSALKPRQYICAGMCIAFLVTHGVLPLHMHITRSGKGSKTYWLNYASYRITERTSAQVTTPQVD